MSKPTKASPSHPPPGSSGIGGTGSRATTPTGSGPSSVISNSSSDDERVILLSFLDREKIGVDWPKKVAMVSPSLKRALEELESGQPQAQQGPGENVKAKKTSGGGIEIDLKDASCRVDVIKEILDWCKYHIHDQAFKDTCTFEDFDEDEYEKEQQRIAEVPCFYD